MELSRSDWVGIISATISLIVAIVIAILQYKQSLKMEKRQDERNEIRRTESAKVQATAFVSKYYRERELVPLCAIAAMYNNSFCYTRNMYREFCCLTAEIQNIILQKCRLDLQITNDDNFYKKCLSSLNAVVKLHFPNDKSILYDNGKYLERALTYHGECEIPYRNFEYREHISDILSEAFFHNDTTDMPISRLCHDYNFGSSSSIGACQFVTTISQFIALYGSEDTSCEKNYGTHDDRNIETMEDLFLLTMFDIYTYLVLPCESDELSKCNVSK